MDHERIMLLILLIILDFGSLSVSYRLYGDLDKSKRLVAKGADPYKIMLPSGGLPRMAASLSSTTSY